MAGSIQTYELIGVFSISVLILTPIICWVLPHHFSIPSISTHPNGIH